MHKALHPKDDVDRLSVSRKEGGTGHTIINVTVERLEGLHRKTRRKTNHSHDEETKIVRKKTLLTL